MKCPQCAFENPQGVRFCGRCGARLGQRCPSCGTPNPEGFTFCGACGSALRAPLPGAVAVPAAEERKVVTILFADVTGSTSLAERLDPERVRAVMARFFDAMAGVVGQFGGTVEKFIGDEVMAVFGLPAAHEDDPERAVRAALAMHAKLVELNAAPRLTDAPALQMRIGINTGEVVANPHAVEKGEFMVTGDAVNVASRLRGAAQPGTTLVGERTYRRTEWLADYGPSPPLALKGKAEPVPAWILAGLRAEPAGRAGMRAPLIGRETESMLLQGILQRVIRERKPYLVTVLGLPGVGKTRLFEELVAANPKVLMRQGRSLPYGGASMWAVGEILRGDCGILRTDPVDVVAQKLRRRTTALLGGDGTAGDIDIVIAQLSRVLAMRTAPPDETADDSRDDLFWALRRYFEAITRQAPLILTFEDAHAADAELLDLIEYLAAGSTGALFLLCLARTELTDRRPGWGGGKMNHTSLLLDALPEPSTQALLEGLLRSTAIPDSLTGIVAIAGGNPLFVEEIVRMLIDRGALVRTNGRWVVGAPLAFEIPDSVQGVITARLDRLGRDEKAVVLDAAILGKDFWGGALQELTGRTAGSLDPLLTRLIQKDFLIEREVSRLEGQREFTFKHILIRDVAYSIHSKAGRAEKHRAFGTWLERVLADRAEEFAELLTHHWVQATQLRKETGAPEGWRETAPRALQYLLLAGRKASRVYAHDQAITHFTTARGLAEELGADAERVAAIEGLADVYALEARWDDAFRLYRDALSYYQEHGDVVREARVESRIGSAFSGIFDFRQALPHIQSAMGKLRAQGERAELIPVYIQMARAQASIGNLQDAEHLARTGLQLAQQSNRPVELTDAEVTLGIIDMLLGRAEAVELLQNAAERAEAMHDHTRAIRAYQGLGAYCRLQGDYPASRRAQERGVLLGERMHNRPRLAYSLYMLGRVEFLAGDWRAAAQTLGRYMQLSEQVPSWAEAARSVLAFIGGDVPAALEWAQKAVAQTAQRNEMNQLAAAFEWTAFLYLRLGQAAETRTVLRDAMQSVLAPDTVNAGLHLLAAEAAVAAGDLQAAAEEIRQAEAGQAHPAPVQAGLLRTKGLLQLSRGEVGTALESLQQAADLYRTIGQVYHLALTLEALAAGLHARGHPPDAQRARDALRDALEIYHRLEALPDIRRLQESTR